MSDTMAAASATVEADARPGAEQGLNTDAAHSGTTDLNASFCSDKHECSFHAFYFRLPFAQGEHA